MKTLTWRNRTCLPAHSIGLSWGLTTSYITFLLKFEYCFNFIKFLSCPFRNAIPFAKLVISLSSAHLYRLSLVLILLLKVLLFFFGKMIWCSHIRMHQKYLIHWQWESKAAAASGRLADHTLPSDWGSSASPGHGQQLTSQGNIL